MDLPTENIQVIFPSYISGLNRNIVRFQPVMSLVWKAKQFRICSAHSRIHLECSRVLVAVSWSVIQNTSREI